MTGTTPSYQWLADYYDAFFSELRGPIDDARGRLLARVLPDVETACDLACGTGETALALARDGIRMYAVDLSPAMCRITREKARRAGLPVTVIHADMRAFRLPRPVDLVTCEGDALNHVPRPSDLRAVASAVARALRPGGHFFFDVNNARGFASYWRWDVWFEKPGFAMVMRNRNDERKQIAWSDIECFVREGRTWRRHHESVREVCWDPGEIRRVFQEAGFDSVRAWDAAPFFGRDSMIVRGCRSFYVARKAAG